MTLTPEKIAELRRRWLAGGTSFPIPDLLAAAEERDRLRAELAAAKALLREARDFIDCTIGSAPANDCVDRVSKLLAKESTA